MTTRLLTAAIMTASFLAPYDANAGTASIYDNLSAVSDGVVNAEQILSDSFSTGNYGFTLFEVSLLMQARNPADGDDFTVTLSPDDHGVPSSSYIDFVQGFDMDLSSTLRTQIFVFPNVVLSPDTRYWVVLGGPGTVQWSQSSDISGPGVSGQFFGITSVINSNACCGGPFQMQITGDLTVPEPSTWAMMLLGLAGLGYAGYRQRGTGIVTSSVFTALYLPHGRTRIQ